ncbi:MAG: saccharopine dehydrogenase NADP-binding domain-containing protein [Planctomycetes bacterium]|nr:saccharopine dehydrogenase NADP-binding domain-containing protein [Planctomycetota bacterium]
MHQVLVLGAGLVSRPLVRYLLDKEVLVTVADRFGSRAQDLVGGHANGRALQVLADDEKELERLVREHDLSVSLLPAPLHPLVAEMCIKHKKHMVTTSYVSDAMRAMDKAARDAGVTILNEIGLDPGIDHMSAMRIIDGVKKRGGEITSFRSYCGGLPAPDVNDNPWGYKFSWSPRAVCTAGKNSARWRENGKEIKIPGPELFLNHHKVDVAGFGTLEAYPNRDSLGYLDVYGLKNIQTLFRGTFRYEGWCNCLKKVVDLGLLSEEPVTYPKGMTLAQWTATFLKGKKSGDLRADLARECRLEPSSDVLDRFAWLGLFSNEPIPLAGERTTPLDVLAARMLAKMPYRKGERDMIVLCHYFIARFKGGTEEEITSTLIDFGQPNGDSSMSRSVSLPAAIGAKMILDGALDASGVQIPVIPAIYNPVLDELERLDIRCVERTKARA